MLITYISPEDKGAAKKDKSVNFTLTAVRFGFFKPMPEAKFSSELLVAIRTNIWRNEKLDLSRQPALSLDSHLTALLEALKSNTYIKSLRLSNCKIGRAGIRILATNTTLTALDVNTNNISDESARILAANNTLRRLDISVNNIGAAGARALAANTTLTVLEMGGNNIGAEGARALAASRTLTTLGVSVNAIGDEGARALATSPTLTTLDVSSNSISNEGAKALAANTILTTLKAEGNHITLEGARAFAANATFTALDLNSNDISREGIEAFVANATLTMLDVSNLLLDLPCYLLIDMIVARNRKRLANIAGLSVLTASFRAQEHSEIKLAIIPLIPLINNFANFDAPSISLGKVIGTTFFRNLAKQPMSKLESEDKVSVFHRTGSQTQLTR